MPRGIPQGQGVWEPRCCGQHFPGGICGHRGAVVVRHRGDYVGEGSPGTHYMPACARHFHFAYNRLPSLHWRKLQLILRDLLKVT